MPGQPQTNTAALDDLEGQKAPKLLLKIPPIHGSILKPNNHRTVQRREGLPTDGGDPFLFDEMAWAALQSRSFRRAIEEQPVVRAGRVWVAPVELVKPFDADTSDQPPTLSWRCGDGTLNGDDEFRFFLCSQRRYRELCFYYAINLH